MSEFFLELFKSYFFCLFLSKYKIFLFFSYLKDKPFIFLLEKNFPSMVKGIDLSDLILKLLFFDIKTLIIGSLEAKTLSL